MIRSCEYEEVSHLSKPAHEDGVKITARPSPRWYKYEDVACACLWEPQNRTNTKRLSSCWVHPDHRGNGIGKALVLRRVSDALTAVDRIDTYAYSPDLFHRLGFTEVRWTGKAHYLVYSVE